MKKLQFAAVAHASAQCRNSPKFPSRKSDDAHSTSALTSLYLNT